MSKDIILASASPRRRRILEMMGLDPVVRPAAGEERIPPGVSPDGAVRILSGRKAGEAAGVSPRDSIIIAADTVVYKDEIMGKPQSKADGMRMLSALRGTYHYVATGVALVEAGRQNARVFAEVTKVWFGDYSDEELEAYLDTDEAYDKAGGYAIQGYFSRHVDRIEGDCDTVIGFPWAAITRELELL